jgi:O-antigen/teichoic acid export membrane protein
MPDSDAPVTKFLSGSAWMLGMRWSMRLIGLATTIILARLLDPLDFGIIAMAMIITGLLQIVTWTGVDLALIKDQKSSDAHYNTAWTIQIIQGFLLAALLLIAAPFSEQYFNEPRVVAVIQALALNAIIQGFGNIGVVEFRKRLDFATEFRFGFYKKFATFLVTVPAAVIIGNYWAIVISMIFSALLGVLLSYMMHPYRPRFSMSKGREIWSFSQWLLVSRLGIFLNRKLDALIIGNVMGTQAIGIYHVAYEIGTLFSDEFVMPIRRALFPNMALLRDNKQALENTVYTLVSAVAVLCMSAGFGISAIAHSFTYFVLGEKWMEAADLIHWLAIFGAIAGTSLGLEVVLLATDRPRLSALEAWAQVAVVVPLIYWAANGGNLVDVAEVRTAIAGGFLVVMSFIVSRACGFSMRRILGAIARPLIAAWLMWWIVGGMQPDTGIAGIPSVLFSIAAGVIVFAVTLLGIWWLAGRPAGAEQIALDRLRSSLRRRQAAPDTPAD